MFVIRHMLFLGGRTERCMHLYEEYCGEVKQTPNRPKREFTRFQSVKSNSSMTLTTFEKTNKQIERPNYMAFAEANTIIFDYSHSLK